MGRPGGERGSVSVELAILAPGVITLFVVALIAGRYSGSLQASDSAAYDAARTASLQRTAAAARTQAQATALASFRAQGITCRTLTVTVNTSEFSKPVGTPASVTATVTCVVELKDITLPGLPGSTTLTSTFTSPLDTYRGRR